MTGSGQTAVVTGCAGFIGSHLAERLLSEDRSVLGIDCFNDNYGRPQKLLNLRALTAWERFKFVPVDLAHGDLTSLLAESQVVFHLAAEPGVRTSWGSRYDNYLRNNVLATQHLLEALREMPDVRLVYASSSSVYGDADLRPTPESARLVPRSPYGQTKVAMEHLCELYRLNFGIDTVGLRYFTVFGSRQRPDMAFHRLCRAIVEQSPFRLFGDGTQTRDFTHVDDIVSATCSAATAKIGGANVFNVGGGSPASLRQAIEMLEDLTGRTCPLVYEQREHGDVRDTAADTTQARSILGFEPRVTLADGLAQELRWVEEQLARGTL